MKKKPIDGKKRPRIFLTLILLCFILTLVSFTIPEGLNPVKTASYFKKRNIKFRDTMIKVADRNMRFVCAGDDNLPMLLFIHGSPGSWDVFKEYLSDSGLLAKAFLVSVDRAGYGESGRNCEVTLQAQADCISGALQLKKSNLPLTIVGHSYGGAIAVKLALQHPLMIKQLILIAPTLSPEIEESSRWKHDMQTIGNWRIFRWAISKNLKNCSKEIQQLPIELRIMEKEYYHFSVPVLEIHGTRDVLAPIGNQHYAVSSFSNAQVDTILLKGRNHFIPFTMTKKMIAIIKDRL
jgi:pimeloyl-ACP methyl ester carboxylesterase